VLGIMRQESNFDAAVVSPAGAQGLMQVMPATARSVSAGGADLFDPAANTRIGTAYLQRLLGAFPEPAEAVAAYNAGPNRVRAWLAALDPGTDATNLIDWIELIPFNETRNYVQRVLEGQAIYAAKLAKP
jgi:soluble lytic murein transglycosylase